MKKSYKKNNRKTKSFLFSIILAFFLLGLNSCKSKEQPRINEPNNESLSRIKQAVKDQKTEISQVLKDQYENKKRLENLQSTWIFLHRDGFEVKIITTSTKDGEKIAQIFIDKEKKFTLKQKQISTNKLVYTDGKRKIQIENSVLSFSIEEQVQPMVLLSPLKKDFSDGKADYKIIYIQDDKNRLALIKLPQGSNLILPQVEVSANSAIYTDGKTSWKTNGSTKGTLTKNGEKIELFNSVKK